jgi:hypothetical protein
MAQRPRYISFYQPKDNTPEIIVTLQEAKQWLSQKNLSYTHMNILSSKRIMSPVPSLSISNKDRYPFMHMSSRRAGCN